MVSYCPECGKKVEGSPRFCPDCGNQLSMETEPTKKTPVVEPGEDHRRTLSTVYLIAGILSILLPLIIFVSMEM